MTIGESQIITLLQAIHSELIIQRPGQIKKDEYRNGVKAFYHKIGCDGDSQLTNLSFSHKSLIYCSKCGRQEILE